MEISNGLIEKAQEIRLKLLNSSNQNDNIVEINSDWKLNKVTDWKLNKKNLN